MVCCGAGVVGRSVPESPGSLFSPSPPLLLTTVLVSCPTKLPLPLSKSLHSCSLGRCLCLVTLHSSLLKTLWRNSAVGGHLRYSNSHEICDGKEGRLHNHH